MKDNRDMPRDFRVVDIHGVAHLFDNSERTFLCCFSPSIWAVPLYWIDGSDEDLPDPGYYNVPRFEEPGIPVPLDPEILSPEYDEDEAWEDATEEAHKNHLI